MSFTKNEFAKDRGGDLYHVRDINGIIPGSRKVTLLHLTDLVITTESEAGLLEAGIVPMQLIEKRVGPFKRGSKPKFRRNTWVKHIKTKGLYMITGTPEHRFMEKTGEPAYEYMNNEGVHIIRCQTEMEDGRFVEITKEELIALRRSSFSR